jgi:ATP-dependent RNA helicase DDX56/DBP9
LKSGDISNLKDQLEFLIVDEADLMFSLGYEADMKELLQHLPSVYQAFLTSATLNDDVKTLKKLFLHNPLTLKLEDGLLASDAQLTQFQISCEEEDKFVLIYALLKLKLVHGRSIIFGNSIDRCYRLKLFLEQFGIRSCVLNSELPASSRCHIVQQYNEGVYDLIIATDEARFTVPPTDQTVAEPVEEDEQPRRKKKKAEKDQESGVSRGIDFYQVANVINFDFPSSVNDYIHRVGRTARGWNRGSALSFAMKSDRKILTKVRKALTEAGGTDVLKPYRFRMEELDGFRYRAQDVLRAVSRKAVLEARLKEISDQVLHSKRLKGYFAENPRDHQIIRHDSDLQTVKLHSHLNHVPEYIVPPMLRGSFYDIPKQRKKPMGGSKKKKHSVRSTPGQKKFMKRKANPLKSFDPGDDSD